MFIDKKKDRKRKRENDDDDGSDLLKLFKGSDIDTEGNHIYFYTDVNQDSCLDLNRKLIKMQNSILKQKMDLNLDETPKIYLHINSPGGCLFSGFSTLDVIKYSKVPVVTIIEGMAASAATMMSIVAQERYMTPNSYMLIHQLSYGLWGKFEEQVDDFRNSSTLMENIVQLYLEHTNIKEKMLRKMLKRDIYWNYDECKKNGLVDGMWCNGKIAEEEE